MFGAVRHPVDDAGGFAVVLALTGPPLLAAEEGAGARDLALGREALARQDYALAVDHLEMLERSWREHGLPAGRAERERGSCLAPEHSRSAIRAVRLE